MGQIKYFTLASVRNEDAEAFDRAIKAAFIQAASDVGHKVTIHALCDFEKVDVGISKVA